ncbi:MAG: hypothetical protein NVS4B8_16030 [Herpetosiphon sp.]
MTSIDFAVLVVLSLAAAGGYREGGLRALTGLIAIAVLGLVGYLVVRLVAGEPGAVQALTATAAAFIILSLLVVILATLFLRSLPLAAQKSRWNRWLGAFIGLTEAIVIVAALLALAERLAPDPGMQAMIRSGLFTGPLLIPFDMLEQALIVH